MIVTQQLVHQLANQVIQQAVQAIVAGSGNVIEICRAHPDFMKLELEDRDKLIDAVFTAATSSPVSVVRWHRDPNLP